MLAIFTELISNDGVPTHRGHGGTHRHRREGRDVRGECGSFGCLTSPQPENGFVRLGPPSINSEPPLLSQPKETGRAPHEFAKFKRQLSSSSHRTRHPGAPGLASRRCLLHSCMKACAPRSLETSPEKPDATPARRLGPRAMSAGLRTIASSTKRTASRWPPNQLTYRSFERGADVRLVFTTDLSEAASSRHPRRTRPR
jgi:hypothetical protein